MFIEDMERIQFANQFICCTVEKLCQLSCSNPDLDICNVAALPGTPVTDASQMYAMSWRFFPTLDPQVNLLIGLIVFKPNQRILFCSILNKNM